ncbi:hypothetical protein GGQ80_002436 [Sphingomonas jinjuensis]|uniref:DUF4173 domain-containing protein n=1 Tax=Sphingomonas jinjuensis TaxID=535907 RepID=A0A840F5G3_9SPHN|nr:DUF4173 domain-containing protein [Sphingomonas jinjuensis]MBB4154523.1 hypothetical protein [Sphingomonas jinjuensis]
MRGTFLIKAAGLALAVLLFDRLFPDWFDGIGVGLFAGGWVAVVVATRRDIRHRRIALVAALAAAVFAGALVDDPGPLAWALFWVALSLVALLPKAAAFDDAWRWGVRLFLHPLLGLAQPFADLARLRRRHGAHVDSWRIAATLGLPLIGGAAFLLMFAAANPLIEQALGAVRLPPLWRIPLWIAVTLLVWPSLRPSPRIMALTAGLPDPEPRLPGTSLPSVLIALALFNLIFVFQNGLDIAFLWSGGALPDGISQAEYVHRGAYPLIGTAMIAGIMALAMFRPGSASEHHPWARRLVILWVAQNSVLVASSALRRIDYIEASMLTAWRIAALAWMALVTLGLVLIAWRIVAGKSARWLVNCNALAAATVLSVCAFVDLGATAAAWNVRDADPRRIDLCYLRDVGDGALLPLIHLEGRLLDPVTRYKVRYVRWLAFKELKERQDDSSRWTPRGARRLAEATALGAATRAKPASLRRPRTCDGSIDRSLPTLNY